MQHAETWFPKYKPEYDKESGRVFSLNDRAAFAKSLRCDSKRKAFGKRLGLSDEIAGVLEITSSLTSSHLHLEFEDGEQAYQAAHELLKADAKVVCLRRLILAPMPLKSSTRHHPFERQESFGTD